jgi:hypothetical protein
MAQYNYRGGEHELLLFFNKPTPDEINAVRVGEAEFALFVERSLIILLFKFGDGIPWSDAPYSIHLIPKEKRKEAPETTDTQYALLHIVLVDASNGVINALRVISMPPEFTQALHRAINAQLNMIFTSSAYNGELENLFERYSSETLAQMAYLHFTSAPRQTS